MAVEQAEWLRRGTATSEAAATFRLRTPLLQKGRSHHVLATTDRTNVAIKCYASGGENVLHTHVGEDHVFVVLQGKARFYDKQGGSTELGRNEGILLAGGYYYYFESCADEPLVLLRVGAHEGAQTDDGGRQDRIAPDGHVIEGGSVENKHEDPVPMPNAFYE